MKQEDSTDATESRATLFSGSGHIPNIAGALHSPGTVTLDPFLRERCLMLANHSSLEISEIISRAEAFYNFIINKKS